MTSAPFDALLFDKDGTLFDFEATWNGWSNDLLAELCAGDAGLKERMAQSIGFDLERVAFQRDSVAIAGTASEIARALHQHLPDRSVRELVEHLDKAAAEAALTEAVPLAPFLDHLRTGGLRLGVMTNDGELPARRHLERSGVLDRFEMVIGSDSGFGAKPDAAPLLAFAERLGLAPDRIAMIGDSLHDLHAGRAAGMATIGVLTGMADRAELAPRADVVLPDIGHIPAWIGLGPVA